MLAMLHRSCLVLRVDELAQGSGQLVAKRYDQGSSPEGVRVSASGTVALEQEALRAMQTAFTDTGLFSRSGFWKNTAYRDGEVDPFTGAFLFECGGGGRYGMAVFEPPLAGAGEEGRHAQEVVDQGLRLIGTDFLSAGQLGEYVR